MSLAPQPPAPHSPASPPAAPGWRTWTRRFFVLAPSAGTLSYYEAGPTHMAIAGVLGPRDPSAQSPAAAEALPMICGTDAERLAASLAKGGEKGEIGLRGAVISTSGFTDSDGAGTLAELACFQLTAAGGRVYRFVAAHAVELQAWLDLLHAAILLASRSSAASGGGGGGDGSGSGSARAGDAVVGALSPSDARALLDTREESKSGWLHKADPRGGRWKRRFFVLRGATLAYYTDASRSDIKGSVPLHSHFVAESGPGPAAIVGYGDRPSGIAFPTAHKLYCGPPATTDAAAGSALAEFGKSADGARPYYLCAEASDEAAEWVTALRRAIEACRVVAGIAPRYSGVGASAGLAAAAAAAAAAVAAAAPGGGGGGDRR